MSRSIRANMLPVPNSNITTQCSTEAAATEATIRSNITPMALPLLMACIPNMSKTARLKANEMGWKEKITLSLQFMKNPQHLNESFSPKPE